MLCGNLILSNIDSVLAKLHLVARNAYLLIKAVCLCLKLSFFAFCVFYFIIKCFLTRGNIFLLVLQVGKLIFILLFRGGICIFRFAGCIVGICRNRNALPCDSRGSLRVEPRGNSAL